MKRKQKKDVEIRNTGNIHHRVVALTQHGDESALRDSEIKEKRKKKRFFFIFKLMLKEPKRSDPNELKK